MEKKSSQTYNINKKYYKDISEFVNINSIEDVDQFINKCFKKGFDIEKYGLIGNETEVKEVIVEKIIEKPIEKIIEVIKEVPSLPIEVEVIKYVDREIIKEVPVEKIVTKIEYISDQNEPQIVEKIIEKIVEVPVEKIIEVDKSSDKTKMLESTLLNLRKELQTKQSKITELEQKIKDLTEQISMSVKAIYLKNSNLGDKI